MDKIEAGIEKAVAGLSDRPEAFQTVAKSIITTDTRWVTIRGEIAPYPF